MEIQRLARRAVQILAKDGLASTTRQALGKLEVFAVYPFVKKLQAARTFVSGGKDHPYFIHHYNATWRNERAVELALVSELLATAPSAARFLEVGNVLSYYFDVPHLIVDKYEQSPGIINQDILEYGSPQAFDLIVSISTLEHVGWDESPRDPDKVKRAFSHMKRLLAPGGRFFLSFPIGYNKPLDQLVFKDELEFREKKYFKRVSRDNRWQEVRREETLSAEYDRPFPFANALFVGID